MMMLCVEVEGVEVDMKSENNKKELEFSIT